MGGLGKERCRHSADDDEPHWNIISPRLERFLSRSATTNSFSVSSSFSKPVSQSDAQRLGVVRKDFPPFSLSITVNRMSKETAVLKSEDTASQTLSLVIQYLHYRLRRQTRNQESAATNWRIDKVWPGFNTRQTLFCITNTTKQHICNSLPTINPTGLDILRCHCRISQLMHIFCL